MTSTGWLGMLLCFALAGIPAYFNHRQRLAWFREYQAMNARHSKMLQAYAERRKRQIGEWT